MQELRNKAIQLLSDGTAQVIIGYGEGTGKGVHVIFVQQPADVEKLIYDERFHFWQQQFARCFKCYACRAAYPLCYCERCADDLIRLLKEKDRCVIAPVRRNDRVDFEVITADQTIAQDYVQTVQSPKHVLFPRVEELFHYERTEDGVTLHENDLAHLPEMVLLAVRPCDTIGLKALHCLRCLGCGACAFVCPVCACFDIQDEGNQNKGQRLRCWDSCGFSQFTLHTSGHNPRNVQSQRWRQRIMHKFSHMPERQHLLGCVGCGRCSRICPIDMNILKKTPLPSPTWKKVKPSVSVDLTAISFPSNDGPANHSSSLPAV